MNQITMKEIAQQAGISRPNVSKILNNKPVMVSADTRKKVLKIAHDLNFRPNYFARSLKTGQTNCIGLLGNLSIVDISAYCFAKVTEGIEQTLAETRSKYSLVMFGANFQADPEKSQELIERRMVDGLIFLVLADDLERFNLLLVPRLHQLGIPFVVVHSISRELPYNNVGLDSAFAGYSAAERFIRLGYEKINFFLRNSRHPQLQEALTGFKQAFKDNRREWRDSMIMRPLHDEADIYGGAFETIKETPDLPRAIFFPDEPAAYGALKACAERGRRVPADLAIIGLDDEDTRYLETRLSTVHHPFKEKGREAVLMLADILDGKRDRTVIHQTILKPHLVVRETCGENRMKEVG